VNSLLTTPFAAGWGVPSGAEGDREPESGIDVVQDNRSPCINRVAAACALATRGGCQFATPDGVSVL
jgi:hypothetical protein